MQVIQSWYVMGRLGAFNSTNLQVWLSLNPSSSAFICYVVRWGCEVVLCGWSHFSIPVYFSYNMYDIKEKDACMFCICWYHYLSTYFDIRNWGICKLVLASGNLTMDVVKWHGKIFGKPMFNTITYLQNEITVTDLQNVN